MVTKKKLIKIRDGEHTQKELLEAVGAILEEQGFWALKTNAIARHIKKDKNLIRYYFDNLEGLTKAYITEKDYWPPFLERFSVKADSSKTILEAMFTDLMQENFRFFFESPAMQKIILWQISENMPLLTRISADREEEGAKILALTDPFFKGTDVNFRMVMALLLGGIYYLVLHARYNKSTVSGVDVNQPDDREELLKTIDQIIGWAWQAAEKD